MNAPAPPHAGGETTAVCAEDNPGPAVRPGGRVVVGIDDSPAGLAALRWALQRSESSGAPLVAVRSWGLGLPRHGGRRRRHLARPRVVLYFGGSEQRDASAKLVRQSLRTVSGGMPRGVKVTVQTPEGDPGAALTGVANRPGDLIVVGGEHAAGHGLRRHGWVSGYCLKYAHCPVVVVPAEPARKG